MHTRPHTQRLAARPPIRTAPPQRVCRCDVPPSPLPSQRGCRPRRSGSCWNTTTSRSLNTPRPLTLRGERQSCPALTFNSEGGRLQPEHAAHVPASPCHVDVPRPVGLGHSWCHNTTRAAVTTAAQAVA